MKKKTKRYKIIVILLVLVIVIALVVALLYLNRNKKVETEEVIEEKEISLKYDVDSECIKYVDELESITYENIIDTDYSDSLYLYNAIYDSSSCDDEECTADLVETEDYYLVCHSNIYYVTEDNDETEEYDLKQAIIDEVVTLDEVNELFEKYNLSDYIVVNCLSVEDEAIESETDEEETSEEVDTSTDSSSNSSSSKSNSFSNSTSSKSSSSGSSNSSKSSSVNSSNNSSSSTSSGVQICSSYTVSSSSDFSSKDEADNWIYGSNNEWKSAGYMVGYSSYYSEDCISQYMSYVSTSKFACRNSDGSKLIVGPLRLSITSPSSKSPSEDEQTYINNYCQNLGYEYASYDVTS